MAVVIDSSVALEWMLRQERAAEAGRVFRRRDDLLVHPLFWLEVAHVLSKQVRSGALAPHQRDTTWRGLESLRLTTVPGDVAHAVLSQVIVLTDRFLLSAYDAAHLATALHFSAAFATFDSALSRATRQAGGVLLDFT